MLRNTLTLKRAIRLAICDPLEPDEFFLGNVMPFLSLLEQLLKPRFLDGIGLVQMRWSHRFWIIALPAHRCTGSEILNTLSDSSCFYYQ